MWFAKIKTRRFRKREKKQFQPVVSNGTVFKRSGMNDINDATIFKHSGNEGDIALTDQEILYAKRRKKADKKLTKTEKKAAKREHKEIKKRKKLASKFKV